MNDTTQQIRPPEQVFDGDNLPDDLKWIMSHFGLPKNDPAVVLIAWHWYRVLNNQDAIHAGAMELKAVLDPRLEKFHSASGTLERVLPSLDKVIGFLAQDDAALKAKVEGWKSLSNKSPNLSKRSSAISTGDGPSKPGNTMWPVFSEERPPEAFSLYARYCTD